MTANKSNNDSQSPTIVLVDDDVEIHEIFKLHLKNSTYSLECFEDAGQALSYIESKAPFVTPHIVITDLRMPGLDGLEFTHQLHQAYSELPIILITAHASIDTAVKAIQKGAFDYIEKPINLQQLSIIVERAIKFASLEKKVVELEAKLPQDARMGEMIGQSKAITNMFDLIERVADSSTNVLIRGESGTGKDLVARALHRLSSRNKGPFVALNCAAIPANLIESELFGHQKGAFTGADKSRKGLFLEAHGGTVFLDEIGEMPVELQAKLLRAIQDKKIRAIGQDKLVDVDVRIVAATNADLNSKIRSGEFREDLFFRLSVINIDIPPLRKRREDIPLLANYFLQHFAKQHQKEVKGFEKEAMFALTSAHWEGNVRQLQNVIERALILSQGNQITEKDISIESDVGVETPEKKFFTRLPTLEQLESNYIEYVLSQTKGKKEKAADILGINRKTLYRKQNSLS